MKLIARRQLHGEYGTVIAGQTFEVRDEIGQELLRNGLVNAAYETKVIEVTARLGFRDVPVPDPQSARVAPESDSMLPGTDVSKPRATRRRRRGAGKGSDSGRPENTADRIGSPLDGGIEA